MTIFFHSIQKAVSNAAFFICVAVLLHGCSKTPDEEQIQLIINEMTSAIEDGKPADIASHLHDNFRANQHMDAKQVRQMLMMYGMQHAKISVTVISTQTLIDPVYTDKASTQLSVMVTGSPTQGLPDDSSLRTVTLEWLKDSEWKLLKADWEN